MICHLRILEATSKASYGQEKRRINGGLEEKWYFSDPKWLEMARIIHNAVMHGTKGAFAKQVVFKTRNGKMFAAKYPDMSNIKPSKEQTKGRKKFAEAIKFAKSVMMDPKKKASYEGEEGISPYYAAIKEYMQNGNTEKITASANKYTEQDLLSLHLNVRQIKAVLYLQKKRALTNANYKQLNKVSKATATRDLQDLVNKSIIQSTGAKGVGAAYTLIGS